MYKIVQLKDRKIASHLIIGTTHWFLEDHLSGLNWMELVVLELVVLNNG